MLFIQGWGGSPLPPKLLVALPLWLFYTSLFESWWCHGACPLGILPVGVLDVVALTPP